jgi:4-carboxymuconolactone decarboxylase
VKADSSEQSESYSGNQMSKERLNQHPKNPSKLTRFERGWATLAELDGPNGPDHALIESLAEVSPDFGRYLVEFSFGEIYQRAALDLKSKELVTIAAATALGAVPTLKVHIQSALNIGASKDEIIDVLLLMLVYAGFPRAINGLLTAKEVFASLDQPTT